MADPTSASLRGASEREAVDSMRGYLYEILRGIGVFTGAAFAELVTGAWLDRCERPAQLVTPRMTVPDIRRAATSGAPGWPRVLGMLEAARNAVSVAAARSVSDFLIVLRAHVDG